MSTSWRVLISMAFLFFASACAPTPTPPARAAQPAASQPAPIAAAPAVPVAPSSVGTGDKIVFKVATGAETGLKAIMEQWRADELKRQGGKFKDSHEWWPYKIDVFDFDNDGALDLLVAHHGPPGDKILRNTSKENGKLTFTDITSTLGINSWDLPLADEDVEIWDFDGDGYLDIGGFSDESRPSSFFSIAAKKLVIIPKFTFNPLTGIGTLADTNGDGYLDLSGVLFNEGTHKGTIYKFVYDPAQRTFIKSQSPYVPPVVPASVQDFMDQASKRNPNPRAAYLPSYKTQYDLNGDGIKDMVFMGHISYRNDTTTCYLIADKEGKLTDQTEALGLPHDGTPALFYDLNGDGNLDIVVSCGAQAGVYLGDGKGHFALVKEGDLRKFLMQMTGHVHTVNVVDFNNDGQMDLVVGLARWPVQQIYQNKGNGVFDMVAQTDKTWTWTPGYDVNGDGLPDVVVGGPGETDVTIYVNQTQTTNHYVNLYPRMPAPNPFAVGTMLEFFHAGTLGQPGAQPFLVDRAHVNGTPIHVGLGQATTFDVRATFPASGAGTAPKVVELKNITAAAKLEVSSGGQIKIMP